VSDGLSFTSGRFFKCSSQALSVIRPIAALVRYHLVIDVLLQADALCLSMMAAGGMTEAIVMVAEAV
jgi:hypothetical protein